ncbi:hypothetical protein CASFOL_006063 [Castilleja foliolosa]|uniref:Uncharacterized protein n=1 Tax=Castilleja foliolosa TaxID=1961234 RepID=A0ABD3E978_9LAMI
MGPENTEDSDRAKFKVLLRKAKESGALDYSSFPPDWLEFGHFPMLACEGSEQYHFSLEMATFALDCINNEDGKTFELVCVDKIAIIAFDQYIIQFTVREVVANDDASLEIIQARVQFPGPDCRDAIVSEWAWFPPSQGKKSCGVTGETAVEIERSMDNRTKNLHETGQEIMGPEVDRKRQKIESSSEHKAIESGKQEKTDIIMDYTDDEVEAIVRKATESGALDYSSFPPDWLGSDYSSMIACEGSENYHFALKIARYALGHIMDDVNDDKTFEVVRVDKIVILFFDQFLTQFTVREVVANADAPLKTIQASVHFPDCYRDYRDAEVSKWRWFHPSHGDSAAAL